MALRTKTIEYAFGTDTTTLAAATRRDLTAITLYIPETSSRTFRSVIVEVNVRGGETTAASMTSWLIGIKLGAAAFNDATTTLTLTNTADQQSFVFTRDVTSYFQTNFGSGTSQTCQVGLQFGGLITQNHSVKLYITYEYDDSTATTRVKTVRIPLESNTTTLSATLASIGSNQIPALDTFLPEASKTYRQIWFECWFNDAGNATTNYNLAAALDAEAEQQLAVCQQALNTAVFGKVFWVRNDMTTNATHDFKARSNATAARFSLLTVVLHVTYEYDHSSSTSIMNSLVLPCADESGWPGSTVAADASRLERTVWIQEPATITLRQSGIVCLVQDPASVTINLKVGAQTSRAYTLTAGSTQSGPYTVGHRIDSGSASGAALTLARGKNTFNFDWFSNANSSGADFTALLYLNYTSGKHTNGDGVHNHSTLWSLFDQANTLATERRVSTTNTTPIIQENNYHITGLSFELLGVMSGAAASGLSLQAKKASGEFEGAGWAELTNALIRSDAELGVVWTIGTARDLFNMWPSDARARMDIETARSYRVCTPTGMTLGCRAWLTYHSITFTVAGTVSGSGGGTVTLNAWRTTDGVKVGSTSRVGNGSYSITVYDNTINIFVEAREDATHLGRSDNGTAA